MSSASSPSPADLIQPLPPDVVTGFTWSDLAYRKYPVFSLPWLKGRTWRALQIIVTYGLLTAIAWGGFGQHAASAWAIAGYFVAGGMLMATIGPALATWVRHRRWPARREGWGVVVAVLLGVAAAACADGWASGRMTPLMQKREKTVVPAGKGQTDDLTQAKAALGNLAGVMIYLVASGGFAVFGYFSERRRLAARAALLAQRESDLRLAVLQAQIEPHFLFNALASIRPLIRSQPERAELALDALAEHLRATIPLLREQSGSLASTLGQQVEICVSYLTVMQVRMGERLRVETEVPRELESCAFPPLMLLSLVENAIKHGIEPKPGPGCIRLQAKADKTTLSVAVRDDGQGLKDGLTAGLGLANIREQLLMRYGGKATLTVAARPGGGTVAEIVVPRSDSLS